MVPCASKLWSSRCLWNMWSCATQRVRGHMYNGQFVRAARELHFCRTRSQQKKQCSELWIPAVPPIPVLHLCGGTQPPVPVAMSSAHGRRQYWMRSGCQEGQ